MLQVASVEGNAPGIGGLRRVEEDWGEERQGKRVQDELE